MTFVEVLMGQVLPIVGNVLSILLFAVPFRDVRACWAAKSVGYINGLPLLMMFFQSFQWVAYGFWTDNILLIPVNIFGTLAGLWYTCVWMGLLTNEDPRKFRFPIYLVSTFGFVLFLGCGLFFFLHDNDKRTFVWGMSCITVCISFYASPLSVLLSILRQRDASPISFPFSVVVICNGASWAFYGIYKNDWFIYIPNFMAWGLGVIQLLVLLCIGKKPPKPLSVAALPTSDSGDKLAAGSVNQPLLFPVPGQP